MRRDGLVAVLKTDPDMDIVAGCPDGQTALDQIRDLHPDVAIVDLNLPGLHGIELVRRVRAESLGTKMIVLSGTMDDEIVREVVRAGADAYLLKNGPARHLTDAIHYVMDGGQYFSPQLHRDGRDRHLLEEPPREAAQPRGRTSRSQRPVRRTADPDRFRERIREEAPSNLREHDYEIMAEMADSIRPILDRLDEIEDRVVGMEEGDEPLPADPRGWLSAQLHESLGGSRSTGAGRSGGRARAGDIESRLPELIDEAVTKRFQSMAGKLQAEIEEQHVRTLETFVKNIQVKLVQRVSSLEQNMSQQADAMKQLHEYNQRTEENLSRLLSGVDKLAQELPKRLAAARQTEPGESGSRNEKDGSGGREGRARDGRPSRKTSSAGRGDLLPKLFWVAVAVAVLGGGGYWLSNRKPAAPAAPGMGQEIQTATKNAAAAAAAAKAAPPPSGADTQTKLDAAKQYMDRKEYNTAEDIYKQVVQAEPKNVDALKGLASVLYREDKIEESAAVLDRLPKN